MTIPPVDGCEECGPREACRECIADAHEEAARLFHIRKADTVWMIFRNTDGSIVNFRNTRREARALAAWLAATRIS